MYIITLWVSLCEAAITYKATCASYIFNCFGACYSDGAVVVVPDNYTTYEFGKLNITCTASGNPMPTRFRWIREGYPQFVQEGPNLVIADVTPEHAGYYTCEATNRLTPTDQDERDWTGRASMLLVVECKF